MLVRVIRLVVVVLTQNGVVSYRKDIHHTTAFVIITLLLVVDLRQTHPHPQTLNHRNQHQIRNVITEILPVSGGGKQVGVSRGENVKPTKI